MRVLLFGSTGKVGVELKRELQSFHYEVVCPDRDVCNLEFSDVSSYVQSVGAKIVINAAAFNGMEACRDNPRRAYLVNGIAPTMMAEGCHEIGAQFVHLSTDYVFDGIDNSLGRLAFSTDESISPNSIYSRSKAIGEVGVLNALYRHLIIRLSSIYNATLTGPLSPLQQMNEGLSIIKTFDQICCPTSATLIGKAIAHAVNRNVMSSPIYGTQHFSTKKPVLRRDFAFYMLAEFHKYRSFDIRDVELPLLRPRFSVMDCRDFEDKFDFYIPTVLEDFDANVENIRGLIRCQPAA